MPTSRHSPTGLVRTNAHPFASLRLCATSAPPIAGFRIIVVVDRFTLAYCHIAHDCTVGGDVIFSNNGTLAGHVTVEDHVILGGLTAVHQFCRLGRHAMTGGCSKIVQDVPPFMLADGNPARIRDIDKVGMERHGFVTQSARGIIK